VRANIQTLFYSPLNHHIQGLLHNLPDGVCELCGALLPLSYKIALNWFLCLSPKLTAVVNIYEYLIGPYCVYMNKKLKKSRINLGVTREI
jgi:hypothetical protein